MPFSMVSSLEAPPVISMICSSNRSSCISKRFWSVNVFGFMSNSTSVTCMSLLQWRGRSASFLRFWMSGSDAMNAAADSSTFLYGRRVLSCLGSFLRRPSNSSMPFSMVAMSRSAHSIAAQSSRCALSSA